MCDIIRNVRCRSWVLIWRHQDEPPKMPTTIYSVGRLTGLAWSIASFFVSFSLDFAVFVFYLTSLGAVDWCIIFHVLCRVLRFDSQPDMCINEQTTYVITATLPILSNVHFIMNNEEMKSNAFFFIGEVAHDYLSNKNEWLLQWIIHESRTGVNDDD